MTKHHRRKKHTMKEPTWKERLDQAKNGPLEKKKLKLEPLDDFFQMMDDPNLTRYVGLGRKINNPMDFDQEIFNTLADRTIKMKEVKHHDDKANLANRIKFNQEFFEPLTMDTKATVTGTVALATHSFEDMIAAALDEPLWSELRTEANKLNISPQDLLKYIVEEYFRPIE